MKVNTLALNKHRVDGQVDNKMQTGPGHKQAAVKDKLGKRQIDRAA